MSSRMALLDSNGAVVNVIVVDDPATYTPPEGYGAAADLDGLAEIGGSYREGAFAPVPATPSAPPGPSDYILSDQQLRIGLITAGVSLDAVEQAIAAMPDVVQRATMQVWWDRSLVIRWDHPLRASLTALLGLTEEQAEEMWMAAKDIQV